MSRLPRSYEHREMDSFLLNSRGINYIQSHSWPTVAQLTSLQPVLIHNTTANAWRLYCRVGANLLYLAMTKV